MAETAPYSPDRLFYWTGAEWKSLLSADQKSLWNGKEWIVAARSMALAKPPAVPPPDSWTGYSGPPPPSDPVTIAPSAPFPRPRRRRPPPAAAPALPSAPPPLAKSPLTPPAAPPPGFVLPPPAAPTPYREPTSPSWRTSIPPWVMALAVIGVLLIVTSIGYVARAAINAASSANNAAMITPLSTPTPSPIPTPAASADDLAKALLVTPQEMGHDFGLDYVDTVDDLGDQYCPAVFPASITGYETGWDYKGSSTGYPHGKMVQSTLVSANTVTAQSSEQGVKSSSVDSCLARDYSVRPGDCACPPTDSLSAGTPAFRRVAYDFGASGINGVELVMTVSEVSTIDNSRVTYETDIFWMQLGRLTSIVDFTMGRSGSIPASVEQALLLKAEDRLAAASGCNCAGSGASVF